ncbi:MAG: hypothetical protein JWP76_1486 [Dactylosporangium sp.]|jgi:hypothetical protein|nr:hypothetical protein [Dactylosporangium sp.]
MLISSLVVFAIIVATATARVHVYHDLDSAGVATVVESVAGP